MARDVIDSPPAHVFDPGEVVSFKLRPIDEHVWVVRAGDPHGRTLRGADALAAFALGRALFVLACPEHPERVRALSVDRALARLLCTIAPPPSAPIGAKPSVVRIDGALVEQAIDPRLLALLAG